MADNESNKNGGNTGEQNQNEKVTSQKPFEIVRLTKKRSFPAISEKCRNTKRKLIADDTPTTASSASISSSNIVVSTSPTTAEFIPRSANIAASTPMENSSNIVGDSSLFPLQSFTDISDGYVSRREMRDYFMRIAQSFCDEDEVVELVTCENIPPSSTFASFACKLCNAKFTYACDLATHMKSTHADQNSN